MDISTYVKKNLKSLLQQIFNFHSFPFFSFRCTESANSVNQQMTKTLCDTEDHHTQSANTDCSSQLLKKKFCDTENLETGNFFYLRKAYTQ